MAKVTQLVSGRAEFELLVCVYTQGTKSWGRCGGRSGDASIAIAYSWKLMLLPYSYSDFCFHR